MEFMPMLAVMIRVPWPVLYVMYAVVAAWFLYEKWEKHFGKDQHV